MRFAKKKGIAVNTPWNKLQKVRTVGTQGEGSWEDGKWYGVKRFFEWMETKSYKMHIRVLFFKISQ